MGREIKRVSLDFDWPLKVVWGGFVNPHYRFSSKCPDCGGSGLNPASRQLSDDWYDFAGTGRRWCNSITQDEVDALIERGRLFDFVRQFVPGKGWQKIEPVPTVTPEMVNDWNMRGMGHDAINRGICVETRAKRLGVWGDCQRCAGEGEIWRSAADKEAAESWKEEGPPVGDGWQVWETVSEGSPISPVFPTDTELIAWLVGEGYSEGAAQQFVKDAWAPSMAVVGNTLYKDIESSAIKTGG